MTLIQLRAGRLIESYINLLSKDVELLQQAKNLYIHNHVDYKTVASLYKKRIVFIDNRGSRISKVISHYNLSGKVFEDLCCDIIELNKFYK